MGGKWLPTDAVGSVEVLGEVLGSARVAAAVRCRMLYTATRSFQTAAT
jgi:hypothetical protein